MELNKYLGDNIMRDIQNKISPAMIEFKNQSNATKLELSIPNMYQAEVFKEGCKHLINVIDEAGAELEYKSQENEILKEENEEYKNKFGVLDENYIKKRNNIQVIIDEDQKHAMKLINRYCEKFDKQNNKITNNKK